MLIRNANDSYQTPLTSISYGEFYGSLQILKTEYFSRQQVNYNSLGKGEGRTDPFTLLGKLAVGHMSARCLIGKIKLWLAFPSTLNM